MPRFKYDWWLPNAIDLLGLAVHATLSMERGAYTVQSVEAAPGAQRAVPFLDRALCRAPCLVLRPVAVPSTL